MNTPDIRSLICFEKLKVGPAIVEPARVKAKYTIVLKNKEQIENELIYSYQEDVFDKSSQMVNMASMILSQVAINYGLFCEEIVFDGLYDDTDKRFILDMLENTSREILVNKILMPNAFLKAPYNQIKAEKLKRYTAASVKFINTGFEAKSVKWEHVKTDKNKYIVLSSGGKDSLLSYGLLKELKKDVYPVFINESGRHWFTAINSYQYLAENEQNTSKVWCNSDRIFNWILKHMPFIREDFAQVRADMYPVRLWTVAVFLFGVLPVAHKAKAANVIIGDEYDTTIKSVYNGITHYQGLYDQSKYFDNALSRYYTKKGWNTAQFSLLRSLSEMLILKILIKRYPHLQQHQISCHAAHKNDERIYPCGKCEKCRRIVAMLLTLDERPQACGYNEQQIANALDALQQKGVKQIGSDASHLFYLLKEKQLLDRKSYNAKLAQAHPEIMKLRFDKERSSPEQIPFDIRHGLYSIYLEYADGAVQRQNKRWIDFDLFGSDLINMSYPFEVTNCSQENGFKNKDYRWELNTWQEIEEKLKSLDTAILPCGSIEQHGPHMPVDIDYFDSVYLADKIAEACGSPKPFVLPALPYGVAYHHEDFKGTISISNTTLSSLVYDLGMSLARNGIKKLIILNGHGDNSPTLLYAAQMINRDSGIFVCVETGETSDSDIDELTETPNDIHAGEIETSTTLAIRPELVQMDKAVNETLNLGSTYLDFSSERGVAWYVRTNKLSVSGVMGDATKASAEKGKRMWEIMIAHMVKFVEEIKKSKLEDLYQKKY